MAAKRSSTAPSKSSSRKSDPAARAQRSAQRQQEEADRATPLPTKSKAAVQAGPRPQPVRLPRQHLKKPAHDVLVNNAAFQEHALSIESLSGVSAI